MRFTAIRSAAPKARRARPAGALAAMLSAGCLMQAPAALADGAGSSATTGAPVSPKANVSATVEQCVTTGPQSERAATFVGEMTAIAGTARMEMRIDLLERGPGELQYHAVSAQGLGVWRMSAPGVKVYKYLRQVTDMSAPAFYRGAIRFRWLNARGRPLASAEMRTPRCEQPPLPEATTAAR
jgi:hypothetical protein